MTESETIEYVEKMNVFDKAKVLQQVGRLCTGVDRPGFMPGYVQRFSREVSAPLATIPLVGRMRFVSL